MQGVLADPNGMIPVTVNGETKLVPAAKFGSKVLCQDHNSVLSPLDVAGKRFFDALHTAGVRVRKHPAGEPLNRTGFFGDSVS